MDDVPIEFYPIFHAVRRENDIVVLLTVSVSLEKRLTFFICSFLVEKPIPKKVNASNT